MIQLYEVGGHVRDGLLGVTSKDIDMAVEAGSWEEMRTYVAANTKKIFLEKPEYLTIRAVGFDGLTKDFVLCRKDGAYSDGRHPDKVEMGTIYEDLARRDFTVNAIARNVATGEYLDPHDGRKDLENRTLRCVGSAEKRFNEDALRIIRAIRFCITKGFSPDQEIETVLFGSKGSWSTKIGTISRDRIREEVARCFKDDPVHAITLFSKLSPALLTTIFGGDIWLEATNKKRKKG